jgi:hypothetical protein
MTMPRSSLLWLKGPTGWVPALCDAAGHFQVDVLTCADPGNLDVAVSTLATQATLALIKAKTDNIPADPAKESGKLTGIDADTSNLDKTLSTWLPVAKARVFNTALPAANADLLGAAISPTTSPSLLLVYVAVSVTGLFYVTRTSGGNTVSEYLNSGIALVAANAYMFTVPWRTGDTINFRYSVTTGTLLCLDVLEVVG